LKILYFLFYFIYLTKEHHVWRPPDGALVLSAEYRQSEFVNQMLQDEDETSAEDSKAQKDENSGDSRNAQRLRPVSVVSRTGARQRAVPFTPQFIHISGSGITGYQRRNARLKKQNKIK
jgi:hypothetical protein